MFRRLVISSFAHRIAHFRSPGHAAFSSLQAPFDPHQFDSFYHDGYFVLRDFLSPSQIQALRTEAKSIVDQFDPSQYRTIFSTIDQHRSASDSLFLSSGDKITCFFEKDAFDQKGDLQVEKSKAINKIGHALHELSPVFSSVQKELPLCSLLTTLGYRHPIALQSMYIFKIGLWFALEDATRDNSSLWVVPGSHFRSIHKRFIRVLNKNNNNIIIKNKINNYYDNINNSTSNSNTNTKNESTKFIYGFIDEDGYFQEENEYHGNGGHTKKNNTKKSHYNRMHMSKEKENEKGKEVEKEKEKEVEEEYDLTGAIPLEVPAGTMVLIHGNLVHFSDENRSSRSRESYTLHVIEGDSRCKYIRDNWLQRKITPAMRL